mmetsp:Transcript_62843/g.136501  ORF Transcript_62843/g.136501 Transcript_62843/m.136501 type:complete len:308 (-) Transcript_62843:307-1230(-)
MRPADVPGSFLLPDSTHWLGSGAFLLGCALPRLGCLRLVFRSRPCSCRSRLLRLGSRGSFDRLVNGAVILNGIVVISLHNRRRCCCSCLRDLLARLLLGLLLGLGSAGRGISVLQLLLQLGQFRLRFREALFSAAPLFFRRLGLALSCQKALVLGSGLPLELRLVAPDLLLGRIEVVLQLAAPFLLGLGLFDGLRADLSLHLGDTSLRCRCRGLLLLKPPLKISAPCLTGVALLLQLSGARALVSATCCCSLVEFLFQLLNLFICSLQLCLAVTGCGSLEETSLALLRRSRSRSRSRRSCGGSRAGG